MMILEIKKSHSPIINSKNTTFGQIKFINRENNKIQESGTSNPNTTNTFNHKVTSPSSGLRNNTKYLPKNFPNGSQKVLNGNITNNNFNQKGNNFTLHQRYKSSNSEMLLGSLKKINFNGFDKNNINAINNNTITEEENEKIVFNKISEKNLRKCSPTVSKQLHPNIKTNFNLASNIPIQFSGNFTTNNFNRMSGNKISKCNFLFIFSE